LERCRAVDGYIGDIHAGREAMHVERKCADANVVAQGRGGLLLGLAQQEAMKRGGTKHEPSRDNRDGHGGSRDSDRAFDCCRAHQNACPRVMNSWVDVIPLNAFRLWPRSMRIGPTAV